MLVSKQRSPETKMDLNGTGNSSATGTDTVRILKEYIPLAVEVFGIIGSIFLLLVLTINRKSVRMPITPNIAVCYLLTVDLLNLLMSVSITVYSLHFMEPIIDLNEFACYGVAIFLSSLASLQGYIQSIISIERALAIGVPLKVRILVTRCRMTVAIVGVTLAMLALRVVYTMRGYLYDDGECGFRMTIRKTVLFLGIFDSIIYCAIPSIVLFICTCFIIVLLIRRRRLLLTESRSPVSQSDVRLALILVIMDILYILTSVPFNADLYRHFTKDAVEIEASDYHQLPSKLTRLAASTDWLVLLCMSSRIRRASVEMIFHRRQR